MIWKLFSLNSGSQNVVPGSSAAAAAENLLEMQTRAPYQVYQLWGETEI